MYQVYHVNSMNKDKSMSLPESRANYHTMYVRPIRKDKVLKFRYLEFTREDIENLKLQALQRELANWVNELEL